MSIAQRLQRLEHVDHERRLLEIAERIATRYGKDVDEVLHLMREIEKRIERWGIEGEHRRLAREHGLSIEEVERHYQEIVAEWAP